MSLAATYPGYISIAEDPQNIMFGTVQVGTDFGQAKSASVKRTADKEELDRNNGSLLAVILRKPRFELTLKTLFTLDVAAPGLGERIVFPLVGVIGTILDVTVDWEDNSGRMLSIEATSWDTFQNAVTAQHYDGTTWTPIVDTVAVEAPTAPTLVSASINTAGNILTTVFSVAVTVPPTTTAMVLTGSVSGADAAAYATGSGTSVILWNLADIITDPETCTLAYTQPGNGIQDLIGTDLATFSGTAVTNNSTQV
jgi:hypothetical protein